MKRFVAIVALAWICSASAVFGQTDDPVVGVWIENIAKSKYDTGPAPRGRTWIVEKTTDGRFKMIMDSVGADDRRTRLEATVMFDGKDYPVTGSALPLTQSYTRIDARTIEETVKVNGSVMLTAQIEVSVDGKTRTLRESRYLSTRGVPMERVTHSVLISERRE